VNAGRTLPQPRFVRQQLGRYAGALQWLLSTLWHAFRWRVVGTVVTALVGVVVVGAGLALALRYAQALEGGDRLQIGGLVLQARDERTLAAVVVAVLIISLAGALIMLWAQHGIVTVAAELNHRIRTDVALAYGGALPEVGDWRDERALSQALWVLQTRDARRSAIVTRSLLRNILQVAVALGGLGALLYLELRATLVLLGVLTVALAAYYHANTISVRATRRYETVAPRTRRQLRVLLGSFGTFSQPRLRRDGYEAALGPEDVAEETAAFRDRFGAHVYAQSLNLAVAGLVLAGLIGYLGHQALTGAMPWTRMLAYLVALRITLGAVHSVLNAFAFFSRFYPSIERLHRFFAATNHATSSQPLDELPLRIDEAALVESPDATAPLRPGEIIEVVMPVPLSRYSLGLLAPAFTGSDPRRQRRLLGQIGLVTTPSAPPSGASIDSVLPLEDDWTAETARARLGDEAAAVEAAIGLDPTVEVAPDAWRRLTERACARLALAAAEGSRRPVLAVDRAIVELDEAERLERLARGRVVLVCSNGGADADPIPRVARRLVISPRGWVLAAGSPGWVRDHREEIAERDRQVLAPVDAGLDGEDLDDDE
jgi:hypothetical protein